MPWNVTRARLRTLLGIETLKKVQVQAQTQTQAHAQAQAQVMLRVQVIFCSMELIRKDLFPE
jgi:hypothetical protein